MIVKIVGLRRLLFLVVAAALNLVVLCAYLLVVEPMTGEAMARRDTAVGRISELQEKIAGIKSDLAFVKDHQAEYESLRASGFFSSQDRFAIGRAMETVRSLAGVEKFSFTVGDLAEIPSAEAMAAGYRLVDSRIKVDKIDSLLDTNVYVLAQKILTDFPSVTRIASVEIKRTADVTPDKLGEIRGRKPVSFIDASIEFDWITAMPRSKEATDAAQQGFRGR